MSLWNHVFWETKRGNPHLEIQLSYRDETIGSQISYPEGNRNVELLATEFGRELRGAMTEASFLRDEWDEDMWQEMLRRNQNEQHQGICHSHDYLDANVVMANAFRNAFGREPRVGIEIEDAGEDIALWTAAWDVAKRRGFGERHIRSVYPIVEWTQFPSFGVLASGRQLRPIGEELPQILVALDHFMETGTKRLRGWRRK